MKEMNFGTVRSFDCLTGKGWITPNDGSDEVEIGKPAVQHAGLGQLAVGQRLGFRICEYHRTAVDLWATWSHR